MSKVLGRPIRGVAARVVLRPNRVNA